MNTAAFEANTAAPPAVRSQDRGGVLRGLARARIAVQLALLGLVSAPVWWPRVSTPPPLYQGNYAASRLTVGGWSVPMADPFTALTAFLASGTAPATLAVGALAIVGFYALVRGRAFCAYACPVHLVLEVWDKALTRLGVRRAAIGGRWPRGLNVAIAILLLAAAAIVRVPLFEPVNPVNALIRAVQNLAWPGLALVGAVMGLEAFGGRRVFCRHLCPMGGFYSAINGVGFAGVAVNPATCTGCRRCTRDCLAAPELGAAIQQAREPQAHRPVLVQSPHCTLCFDCATTCEHASIVFQNRWRRPHRSTAATAQPVP